MIDQIVQHILSQEKILLILHQKPDGDTIGGSLALYWALYGKAKKVDCVCRDPIPKVFSYLADTAIIKQDFLVGDYDLIIVLDCGDLRRTGFPERIKAFHKKGKTLINIDHHPHNDLQKMAKLNILDQSASSVCQIVYKIIEKLDQKIDRKIATALLTGLYFDTGGFKHSNTTTDVLSLSSLLMKKGANLQDITKYVRVRRRVSTMHLWGLALSRAKRNKMGIVRSVITQDDLKRFNTQTEDLAGFANLLSSVDGAKAAFLLYETEGENVKVIMRTDSARVDLSSLAELFGGGGQKKAAGFCFPGKIKVKGDRWHIEYAEG